VLAMLEPKAKYQTMSLSCIVKSWDLETQMVSAAEMVLAWIPKYCE
jgi:hypothetical protein